MVRSHEPMWQQQDDATLNQANPVSGTKYTVLDTVYNARIKSISVTCTWTVQPTPLEIHMTIDGVSITFTVTDPVSTTPYSAAWLDDQPETAQDLVTVVYEPSRLGLVEGQSVKIEAEITGGTVSNLSARVKYAKRV